MKPTTTKKKESVLSVLREIRDLLKERSNSMTVEAKPTLPKSEYFTITDTPNLTTSAILKTMREKFDVWCYLSNEEMDTQFPAPKAETTRYFKKTVEADEELKNKSADNLEKEGIKGITLRERLLMEIQYFDETGKHLDVKNWTLCSGSRYSDGYVPCVRWGSGSREVYVYWDCARNRVECLRSRQAVSL